VKLITKYQHESRKPFTTFIIKCDCLTITAGSTLTQ
jgi:hypothetical protein